MRYIYNQLQQNQKSLLTNIFDKFQPFRNWQITVEKKLQYRNTNTDFRNSA